MVIDFCTVERVDLLRATSCTKELNLHWDKVRVLAELDGLLAECSRHDEDVFGWALEVNLERDSLILVKLEECDWLERSKRTCILHALLLPGSVVLQLEVAEYVGHLKCLQGV